MGAEVRIIVSGEGNAVQVLGGVQHGIQGVGQEAEKQSGGVKGFFGGIAQVAGGILTSNIIGGVASQLSGMFTGGIADARETAQLMGQTAAVIKSTGGAAGVSAQQVADYASALSDASGASLFGDDQIQQSENLLLTFTNIKDKTLEAATAISVDMAQALGGAPKDSAIQLGKALNDPINGVTALTRVGVTFTDQQKEQIKTMQEAGDMAGAQGIILAELNKEFGGSAKAAADATGGWSQFQGVLGEAAESVAAALLPAFSQLGALLASPEVSGAITQIATDIGTGLAAAIDFVATQGIPALTSAWNVLQPAIAAVAGFISDNLQPILASLAAIFVAVVVPAFVAWAVAAGAAAVATIAALAPVLIPIAAIGAAVALLKAAWDSDFLGIKTTLTDFWTNTGQPIFETLRTWLATYLPVAIQALSIFWTTILWPALQTVWGFLNTNVIPILGALANIWIALVKLEIRALATLWSEVLWPALQKVWNFIDANVIPIFGALGKVAKEDLGPALSWFKDNILDPMAGAFDAIGNAISGVIGFLHDLADAINSLPSLPGDYKHSSPSPFELSMRGIGDALATSAVPGLMLFNRQMLVTNALGSGGANVNVGGMTINASPGMNIDQLANEVIDRLNRRLDLRG